MNNTKFSQTDTPEVWTRELARVQQFTELEIELFRAEIIEDYVRVLRIARMILRLQMEVMEEKQLNDQGKKIELKGKQTSLFITMKLRIDNLEERATNLLHNNKDPANRINNQLEKRNLINEIKDFLDDLFNVNTILGINYKKKNDPFKAAYS